MGFIYFAPFGCVIVAWDVDKLQNEGSPSDDAAASGQKVPSYDILQHRRFSRGLGANDDLGKLLAGENICGLVVAKWRRLTICGRSRESLPIVLKTRSWSLLTIPSKFSPRDAIFVDVGVRMGC